VRLFHRHKYVLSAVHPFVLDYDGGGMSNKTRLLFVCQTCGKVKTAEIFGSWTLEEVKNGNS
jgi:hypothetical protein